MTRVKICGLTNEADARCAIECGADALGFVLEPKSPRYLGDDLPTWLSTLPIWPPKIAVFGRENRTLLPGVFDAIQAVEWDASLGNTLRRIEAIRLDPRLTAEAALALVPNAQTIHLDAFRPDAYGGTGHVVDWDLAAEIVRLSKVPVVLAGGLTVENVAEAIRRVRPFAVDLSSGVEASPGKKDHAKVRDFIQAAKGA